MFVNCFSKKGNVLVINVREIVLINLTEIMYEKVYNLLKYGKFIGKNIFLDLFYEVNIRCGIISLLECIIGIWISIGCWVYVCWGRFLRKF